ncbi:MAG: hypothetical protein IPG99_19390 [Ignavibacteria bacterium]|nr:hypothetical protein [Ignavibacteria bacterium]
MRKDYKIDVTDPHEIRNVDVILAGDSLLPVFAEVIQYAGKRAAGDLGVDSGLTFSAVLAAAFHQLKVFLCADLVMRLLEVQRVSSIAKFSKDGSVECSNGKNCIKRYYSSLFLSFVQNSLPFCGLSAFD